MYDFRILTTCRGNRAQVEARIKDAYPGATFDYRGEEMVIGLRLRGWRMKPTGDEGYFGALVDDGYIGKWRKFSRRVGSPEWQKA